MPWVRLDDRFPSHRKISLLSDRAFRLHVSAICWSAENLTDGRIGDAELRVIAHVRSMKATATELEKCGLWERLPDGWRIHDYLDYQFSREQVLAERENNAARQQAYRDRKNAKPKPPGGRGTSDTKIERNAVTDTVTNAVSNGCPMPAPDPVLPPKGGSTHAGGAAPSPLDDVDRLKPLRAAIAAEPDLIGVSWSIRKASDWERIRLCVERVGTPAMVAHALGSTRAFGPPAGVTAWIAGWEGLQAAPPTPLHSVGSDIAPVLPFQQPGRPLTGPDANLAGHAALIAELRAREGNQ